MKNNKPVICMFRLEYSNVIYDSRVLREAKTLGKENNVTIIDVLGDQSCEREVIEGIKIERIRLWSKSLPSNVFGRLIKYLEFIIKATFRAFCKNAQVYHAHDFPVFSAALIAGKLRRAKIVYDSHELYLEMGTIPVKVKGLMAKLENFLCQFVDQIIVANESRAKIMQEKYQLKDTPQAITNCPSLTSVYPTLSSADDFLVFLQEHNATNKKVVLYQGGLMSDRGLEQLVMSASFFNDDIVLVIIGEGQLKKTLQEMVVSFGLETKVIFHPYVSYKKLLLYTMQADLGVVIYKNTCLNNYYCAPNKLFEYAAANLPVVASNFPELDKIVSKYDIGKLFDPDDFKSIAKAINSVFASPITYERMKENTNLVKNKFNWENEELKLQALYDGLLKGERK